jgi:Questin oxidase-like
MTSVNYDVLDEALAMVGPAGCEWGGGLANHGPMASEALCAMGRSDAVVSWAKKYSNKLEPRAAAHDRIRAEDWRNALGDGDRFPDWSVFFANELKERPWPLVLDDWIGRLTPGIAAAATHGAIRVGHAVRSLEYGETPARLGELADGLAYLAARYQVLPGSLRPTTPAMASRALARVALAPRELRKRNFGLITTGLDALAEFPDFEPAANLAAPGDDTSAFLSDLTETFAHVYLSSARNFFTTIVFVHSVTGPAALRLIAPHLSRDTRKLALRNIWQTCAAMYSMFGTPVSTNESLQNGHRSIDALFDAAIACGDEHAIKFSEACVREHALNAKPGYLAAASHAVAFLSGAK